MERDSTAEVECGREIMSYRAAAKYVGVPVGTLYSLVSKKQIKHIRIAPRIVRFFKRDLDAWLADRTVGGDS